MNSAFTEKYPIDNLKPYERNPRRITQKAIDAVAKSIRMNGALDPIEIDETGEVLAGHTRLKAYKELGYTECPVIQHIGLTKTQKRTYRIASNKTAEYSEWDDELLAAELKDIEYNIEQLQESTGVEQYDMTIPTENKSIDENEMMHTQNECPKCGFKW